MIPHGVRGLTVKLAMYFGLMTVQGAMWGVDRQLIMKAPGCSEAMRALLGADDVSWWVAMLYAVVFAVSVFSLARFLNQGTSVAVTAIILTGACGFLTILSSRWSAMIAGETDTLVGRAGDFFGGAVIVSLYIIVPAILCTGIPALIRRFHQAANCGSRGM